MGNTRTAINAIVSTASGGRIKAFVTSPFILNTVS